MNSMYFKTLKTSKTGEKFASLLRKKGELVEKIKTEIAQYGASQFCPKPWDYVGLNKIALTLKPDNLVWKCTKEKGLYLCSPKQNSIVGKGIKERWESLGSISMNDLNKCVGFGGYPIQTIGFAYKGKGEYFGFAVGEDWEFKAPKDCIEITYSEYKKLFN